MSDEDTPTYLLTSAEVRLLTGRVKHRTQIDWLMINNIPFLLDASGRPKVLRKFIEERLSGDAVPSGLLLLPNASPKRVAIRPNFAALEVHALKRRGRNHGT